MKYKVVKDVEYDCITVKGLKNDFDSDIILYPISEALIIVDRLEFLEALTNRLVEELKGFDYSEENIDEIIETVKEDLK